MLVLRCADVYTKGLRTLVATLISPRRPVVLVVEANAETRNLIVAVLSNARCVTLGVSTPRIALELLAELRVDAVLLEPSAVKYFIEQPHLRLIALTENSEEVVDVDSFDGILVKPCLPEDVVRIVRAVLARPRRRNSRPMN